MPITITKLKDGTWEAKDGTKVVYRGKTAPSLEKLAVSKVLLQVPDGSGTRG